MWKLFWTISSLACIKFLWQPKSTICCHNNKMVSFSLKCILLVPCYQSMQILTKTKQNKTKKQTDIWIQPLNQQHIPHCFGGRYGMSNINIQYLKSDSHLLKRFFLLVSMIALQKWWKMHFFFILKALFVLKIFKFLSWLFRHVEKTTWLER